MSPKLIVTNIKVSLKFPKNVNSRLDYVKKRCPRLNIPCAEKSSSMLTIRHKKVAYTLFGMKSELFKGRSVMQNLQHCNIAGLNTLERIEDAATDIFLIVNKRIPAVMDYTIDNICCNIDMLQKIDLEKFYLCEDKIGISFHPESFPSAKVTGWVRSLTCQVFACGKLIFIGGKKLSDIKSFFTFLNDKLSPYIIFDQPSPAGEERAHVQRTHRLHIN